MIASKSLPTHSDKNQDTINDHKTSFLLLSGMYPTKNYYFSYQNELRHDKTNKISVRQLKSQVSLGIRPVWSVFAVCMKKPWVPSYPLSAREDSNQSGWMPRLIWVFDGRTVILLVLSCRGSNLCWKASGTWVSSSTWFKCLCILMMIYLQPPSFNQIALWGTCSTLCILCHSYMVWEGYPVYMSRDITKATEFLLSTWRNLGLWRLIDQCTAKTLNRLGADAQADLSLPWMHRSFCWFCHVAAKLVSTLLHVSIFQGEKTCANCKLWCYRWEEEYLENVSQNHLETSYW